MGLPFFWGGHWMWYWGMKMVQCWGQVFFRSGYCCSAGIGSLGLLPASFLQFNGWLKGKSTGNIYIIIIYYIIFVATARIFFWKYRGSNMFFQRFWIDESCHSQHRTILSSLWNISLPEIASWSIKNQGTLIVLVAVVSPQKSPNDFSSKLEVQLLKYHPGTWSKLEAIGITIHLIGFDD